MILRPVRPVSPIGPPITNLPVGLTVEEVACLRQARSRRRAACGRIGCRTCSARSGLISVSASSPSRCCVEIEHALDLDRPLAAVLVDLVADGHLALPSGRRYGSTSALRTSASRWQILCASMIGSGISSAVSFARVAEHHPLVAGADAVERVVVGRVVLRLVGVVDALRDVGRLLVERDDDAAGVARRSRTWRACSRSP